ncbi:MAG: helix-turn-helix domain-containing protein [Treponema sp.]|nr:helix-turn-helix domain-containing protein [Treponema sp.]
MNLLDIREASERIRISVCGLRRLIKARKISFRKIGKKFFFAEADIEEFLSRCLVQAGGQE